jgi:hypothetical protein
VGQFGKEPSPLDHFRGPALNIKTAPRATGLEMALEAILKKGVVWYREGPERRSHRPQTRFIFQTSMLLIMEHLAARTRKSWQTASALDGENISAAKAMVCDSRSRKLSPTCASGVNPRPLLRQTDPLPSRPPANSCTMKLNDAFAS